jgi:hypothetical protein
VKGPQLITEGSAEINQQLLVPQVILVNDFDLQESVIDNDGPEMLFGLAVNEGVTVRLDIRQHLLPKLDIITHRLLDFLGVDHPQALVIEPCLDELLHLIENTTDLGVDQINELLLHLPQHSKIVVVLRRSPRPVEFRVDIGYVPLWYTYWLRFSVGSKWSLAVCVVLGARCTWRTRWAGQCR